MFHQKITLPDTWKNSKSNLLVFHSDITSDHNYLFAWTYHRKIILVDTFFGSFGDPNINIATNTAPYDSASETLSFGLGLNANTTYKNGGMIIRKTATPIQLKFVIGSKYAM